MIKPDFNPIISRCCPNCGFIVTQIQVTQARVDFLCPRCHRHKLSEFQILERSPPPERNDNSAD